MTPLLYSASISFQLANQKDEAFLSELYVSTKEPEFLQANLPTEFIRQLLLEQYQFQKRDWDANYPDLKKNVVVVDEKRIGRFYCDVDNEKSVTRLVDIMLLRAFRGQGIGTFLLRSLIANAEAREHIVMLCVEKHNPAKEFYARFGFVTERDSGIYLEMARTPHPPKTGDDWSMNAISR